MMLFCFLYGLLIMFFVAMVDVAQGLKSDEFNVSCLCHSELWPFDRKRDQTSILISCIDQHLYYQYYKYQYILVTLYHKPPGKEVS